MRFHSMVASSLLALSLVACGSGDDTAKTDKNDSIPPKNQACIDAGDKCTWDGKNWVVAKPGEGDTAGKDDKDAPPVADTNFDYSDIGVTDKVGPVKKGFAFYNKGAKSALDANPEVFKNNPLQKPTINWSSTKEYDDDLYNFVAIMSGGDKQQPGKNADKFMFDKIGKVNQANNPNKEFFGTGEAATAVGAPGISSLVSGAYKWGTIPALVNTFVFRDDKGVSRYVYSNKADKNNKFFKYQEEDITTDIGSGKKSTRVYGLNAFLVKAVIDVIGTDGNKGAATTTTKYNLENRDQGTDYFSGTNFVWYDLTTWGKRKATAKVKDGAFVSAISQYDAAHPFPTDVSFGGLNYVQFGRLTGEGIDPEAEGLDDYKKEVKPYEFTKSAIAISDAINPAGNDKSENFYFGRGIKPTSPDYLEQIKSANGGKVVYNGQAVMFGIDYTITPNKSDKPAGKDGQSTNAVKPQDNFTARMFPLDGKQNFVRMTWNPSDGTMKGEVFGVWTLAKFLVSNTKWENGAPANTVNANDILEIEMNATSKKVDFKRNTKGLQPANEDAYMNGGDEILSKGALKIEPLRHIHVKLDGLVTPGTNSFSGSAVRCKDGDKGLFAGAFFGPQGNEITGVINSQTGLMSNKDLTDPANMWGGAFGAQRSEKQEEEDLFFEEIKHDYGASTEFFN